MMSVQHNNNNKKTSTKKYKKECITNEKVTYIRASSRKELHKDLWSDAKQKYQSELYWTTPTQPSVIPSGADKKQGV